ncbi:uncharacterized protein FIBRA_02892 [Fibroporia radiculosa]|uniref:Heterokaryon incompatibility domain-containing protein n=1 Tax=Fibroporia radiculosa TaxID=599839 RepID=J4H238_9APHY|nr:uncharacterized protein FIBRA_02892 [Fibroporia radiculosa]CCM00849.1 predicted protein [Fibroporia radiculosa]
MHPPLQGARSIRVIRLEPASSPSSCLRCSLVEVSLDDLPEYSALSYAWDAQTPSCPIDCGGGVLSITPNCAAALRRLRHEQEERTLWIDSICIDQTSLEERSHQVALMDEIYRRAKEVVVWLGESDRRTERAMDCLSDIGQLGSDTDVQRRERTLHLLFGLTVKDASDDPIGPLFQCSWFGRMWTVQEATLGEVENVTIHCGDKTLPWIFMVLSLGYLKSSQYKWGRWDEAMQLQRYLSSLLMSSRHLELREVLSAEPNQSALVILEALIYAREKRSTDPKDKIFALFGVFRELGVELPLPDYTKSVELVYVEATVTIVVQDCHHGSQTGVMLDGNFQIPGGLLLKDTFMLQSQQNQHGAFHLITNAFWYLELL